MGGFQDPSVVFQGLCWDCEAKLPGANLQTICFQRTDLLVYLPDFCQIFTQIQQDAYFWHKTGRKLLNRIFGLEDVGEEPCGRPPGQLNPKGKPIATWSAMSFSFVCSAEFSCFRICSIPVNVGVGWGFKRHPFHPLHNREHSGQRVHALCVNACVRACTCACRFAPTRVGGTS